ncbi:unnamed protein product [Thlaspi arvense]|uniref:Uncharacterized protein n=1 Tax=Thlaspi arvense TaxID=13288 RepID=A0AAU9SQV3_THLAR|nr:unnamed protein product [Thlaspi arvense]
MKLSEYVGKNYLCSEWKQELITFSQFLERIQSSDTSSGPTYLAQHPLFDQACITCLYGREGAALGLASTPAKQHHLGVA